MPFCIPEPEPNKSEVEQRAFPQVHVLMHSSDEDNPDNDEENDQPQDPELNGYEPLPIVDQYDSSEEEDEVHEVPKCDSQQKSFDIDQDLVRHAMKNVKLDIAAIPPWAKEISETAWDEVVKQTVGKVTPSPDDADDSNSS